MKTIKNDSMDHFAFEWRIVTIIDTPSSFCLLPFAGSRSKKSPSHSHKTKSHSCTTMPFMVHPRQDPFISELVHRLYFSSSAFLFLFRALLSLLPLRHGLCCHYHRLLSSRLFIRRRN